MDQQISDQKQDLVREQAEIERLQNDLVNVGSSKEEEFVELRKAMSAIEEKVKEQSNELSKKQKEVEKLENDLQNKVLFDISTREEMAALKASKQVLL